jgi:monovalent cation:H+ antiporter-2, CPA2 family
MTSSLGVTLLVSLAAALVLGSVAHRLRLAPIIGYIAAGLLVGPFTPGFVADREDLLALADIGVALLMFSIGLRFRLRELASVGRLVLVGAPIQVGLTMGLATLVVTAAGQPLTMGLFLGAVAAISSSVVLVKVAGEESLQSTVHGRLAIGWSVAQDLITVLLVVVLSALAGADSDPLPRALGATAIALGFVVVVLVLGSRLLPALLARVAHLASRELFIVAVAVIAMGTAALAGLVGVSIALGAFMAGLALAESDLAASVLGEVVPLRELFATMFFVSIGLLLQPSEVAAGWLAVVGLLALIVLGKGLPIALIALAGGQGAGSAFRLGGLLAQAGEFSFVLATAGLQLGALSSSTFSQAMGAVVVSIVLAGPVARGSSWLGDRLGRLRSGRTDMSEVHPDRLDRLHRHAVILGYGRVGRTVARVLEARGFAYVAVDSDYRLVRGARAQGVLAIYGEAGQPPVLDEARIEAARVLIIALPDALATRQAIRHATARNPRIEVVARAHSERDEAELRAMGISRVVLAERQLGAELVRHALRRYGISEREVEAILRRDA